MKFRGFCILLLTAWMAAAQNTPQKTAAHFLTSRFSGQYDYGDDIEKGGVGLLVIYPESDSTLLFYFEGNRGAPSYNMGSLYGRVKMAGDSGVFFQKIYPDDQGCQIAFKFKKGEAVLTSLEGFDDCGFGHGVYAHGIFQQTSDTPPQSFTNLEGREVFFGKTSPEEYNNN